MFKEKTKVIKEEIIQYCCVERCYHDLKYHNERCPIKLVGINNEFPLNPKAQEQFMQRTVPEFQHPDDSHQKQLSDF
ncbi:MAG: hypothetical protein PHW62_00760 [Candidatus Ratteibacteria bacterium]|nr:hypothetical protein [Candidatus Ratteibacteria bacterium]